MLRLEERTGELARLRQRRARVTSLGRLSIWLAACTAGVGLLALLAVPGIAGAFLALAFLFALGWFGLLVEGQRLSTLSGRVLRSETRDRDALKELEKQAKASPRFE